MENFSVRQTVWDAFFYGSNMARSGSPSHTFSRLAHILLTIVVVDLAMYPIGWYYHYDDPLEDGDKALQDDESEQVKNMYKVRQAL